jgi:hypothetical protein
MVDAHGAIVPLRLGLLPVPAVPQVGVCEMCHSSAGSGFRRCRQCERAWNLGPPEILPITMEVKGGLLHDHLRGYKDAGDATVRDRMSTRLAGLLSVFFAGHRRCVGEWDAVTCVPSVERAALDVVVARVGALAGDLRQLLAERPGGPEREMSVERFSVTSEVTGTRVLLLDDTFTSGSAVFSAAAALRRAGATVVGPVVIGRFVDPTWPPSVELLEWLRPRRWDEDRCARCAGELREGRML